MIKYIGISIIFLAAASMTACSNSTNGFRRVSDDNIIKKVEHATSKLMAADNSIGGADRVIVTSFANVDNLSTSSRFGRIVAQQFAAEISADGYTVVEVLMSEALRIASNEGEFLLSREVAELGEKHNADAVVVGTYAEGSENIYVTAKLVRASDSVVLAAHSFDINLGPDARLMIR